MKKMTAPDIRELKGQRKITMLTAYDYPSGQVAEAAGVDMILVGDSLGMVVLGYEDTLSVTMDDMLHHAAAVSRGASLPLIVGDMPFMSYQPSVAMAVENAGKFLSKTGVRAVKLEGGFPFLEHIKAITSSGVPVQGHLGLTPQHVARFGGFKAQGKGAGSAASLVEEAVALESAGCFSIVLEAIPCEVARIITEKVSIPTIGIGAGPETDGQVLVYHDILGLFDRFTPLFAKAYAQLRVDSIRAVKTYCNEVRSGEFPAKNNVINMGEEEFKLFETLLKEKCAK